MQERTTIIIAHRLSTVVQAELIVVLEGGRIVQLGTHAELLQAPAGLYYRLYANSLLTRDTWEPAAGISGLSWP
jgi:ABC-type multidrug transport system fused ATPase/permease subunit